MVTKPLYKVWFERKDAVNCHFRWWTGYGALVSKDLVHIAIYIYIYICKYFYTCLMWVNKCILEFTVFWRHYWPKWEFRTFGVNHLAPCFCIIMMSELNYCWPMTSHDIMDSLPVILCYLGNRLVQKDLFFSWRTVLNFHPLAFIYIGFTFLCKCAKYMILIP